MKNTWRRLIRAAVMLCLIASLLAAGSYIRYRDEIKAQEEEMEYQLKIKREHDNELIEKTTAQYEMVHAYERKQKNSSEQINGKEYSSGTTSYIAVRVRNIDTQFDKIKTIRLYRDGKLEGSTSKKEAEKRKLKTSMDKLYTIKRMSEQQIFMIAIDGKLSSEYDLGFVYSDDSAYSMAGREDRKTVKTEKSKLRDWISAWDSSILETGELGIFNTKKREPVFIQKQLMAGSRVDGSEAEDAEYDTYLYNDGVDITSKIQHDTEDGSVDYHIKSRVYMIGSLDGIINGSGEAELYNRDALEKGKSRKLDGGFTVTYTVDETRALIDIDVKGKMTHKWMKQYCRQYGLSERNSESMEDTDWVYQTVCGHFVNSWCVGLKTIKGDTVFMV